MNRSQAPRPRGQNDLARPQGSGNVRTRDARKPQPAPDPGRAPGGGAARASIVSSALGFVAAAAVAGAAAWASGCQGEAPPGPSTEGHPPHERTTSLPRPAPTSSARATASAEAPKGIASAEPSAAAPEPPDEPEKPYTGPLLGSIVPQAPVYATMEFSKQRLGYIRLGGKVPVDPKPIKGGSCAKGWYRLLDGGYVCGRSATTDLSNPHVRLGITPPNLDDVLPYKYAFNTTHGTPLYRSVPSKDEMARYEPYLESSKRKKKEEQRQQAEELYEQTEKEVAAEAAAPRPAATPDAVASAGAAPAVTAVATEASATEDKAAAVAAAASLGIATAPVEEEPEKPWWENVDDKGRPLNVTLADLDKDADSTVAKRMVKGFFVAVDKTFGWNSRSWYKTTAGLVAPSDRMYIIKPPTSQGIDFPEGAKAVGFILSKTSSKYQFDAEMKSVSVAGSLERFAAFGLTGDVHKHRSVVYRKTTEGWWMKGADGTYTDVGSPPPDLAPGEKWIDVNLSRKTLVAIEGDRPVFAALVSPGRRSKDKKKDHPTPTGVYRIREKHIATTMDGDGTVAGDLPYSIEDVPYVAYYDGSYALHGAFWHSNFGREMSHGCVNLSPLDAKKVFFWSEPRLPRGWHGVWSTPENRGTLVSIHE